MQHHPRLGTAPRTIPTEEAMTRATLLEHGLIVGHAAQPPGAATSCCAASASWPSGRTCARSCPPACRWARWRWSTATAWRSRRASSTCTPTTMPSCSMCLLSMTPKLSQGITTVVTGNCGCRRLRGRRRVGALTLLGRSFKYPSVARARTACAGAGGPACAQRGSAGGAHHTALCLHGRPVAAGQREQLEAMCARPRCSRPKARSACSAVLRRGHAGARGRGHRARAVRATTACTPPTCARRWPTSSMRCTRRSAHRLHGGRAADHFASQAPAPPKTARRKRCR